MGVAAILVWAATTRAPGLRVPPPVALLAAGALALGALRALERLARPGSAGDGIATLLLACLAAIGLWVALAPGVRLCAVGTGVRATTEIAGAACRVPFGIGAVLAALVAGHAARQWWRAFRS